MLPRYQTIEPNKKAHKVATARRGGSRVQKSLQALEETHKHKEICLKKMTIRQCQHHRNLQTTASYLDGSTVIEMAWTDFNPQA
jgi:hypothetical protein